MDIEYTVTDGEEEVPGTLVVTVQAAMEPEASVPEDTQEDTPIPGDVDSGSDLKRNLGIDAAGENSEKGAGDRDDDAPRLGGTDKQAPLPGIAVLLALAAAAVWRCRGRGSTPRA